MRRGAAVSVIRPIRGPSPGHYGSGVLTLVRQLWRLPAPADARGPGRLDLALVAGAGMLAVVEVLVRPDMAWRWLSLGLFLAWLPTLLVRRTRPIVMVVAFSVTVLVEHLTAWTTDRPPPDDLNTALVALLIPYSLTRWASGRNAVVGLSLFLVVAVTSLLSQDLPAADRLGGSAVVVAAVAIGATMRTRSMLRSRQLDDVRRDERERLARDLHDTVAHHLTAIAITSQAGLAVAEARPAAAEDALRRIDTEATRALAETRKVLRMLRSDDEAPDRPLDDLAALATDDGHAPRVEVVVADGLDLSPTVAAAVHRIAQEAVSNARRHAAGATHVRVEVDGTHDLVHLTVTDDGRPTTASGEGYGIVGMTERAQLVGGRLSAGPAVGGGWQVSAVLPSDDRGPR